MTLKTRNRTMILFTVMSSLFLIAVITVFIIKLANNSFENIFGYNFFSLKGFSFFKPSPKSVILGLIFLQFYVPVTSFLLLYNFEKTQSPLIILFCLYLLGNQLEISKLIIALFNMTHSYSEAFLLLGNIAFLGKLISLFSFFLFASESKNTQKLNIETDIIILSTICIVVTFLIPMNTGFTTDTFDIKPGYSNIVIALFAVTLIATILTFIFTYQETENKLILKLLASYCILTAGQNFLANTSILIFTFIGIGMLAFGTSLIMKTMHKMYSWE